MKLAWATDIHLDLADEAAIESFIRQLGECGADAILITGDIAKAGSVESHLRNLSTRLQRPVYFVLGNHDFYIGSIREVRDRMTRASRGASLLKWMPAANVVALTRETALVGHDGWGDARLGNVDTTPIRLNDFVMIEELSNISREERNARLRKLGDEAAAYVREVLPQAVDQFPRVLFMTHVPPFREACWHEGEVSEDDWLPYFTCRAVGDALEEVMRSRPKCDLTVLCGHTHGAGTTDVLPNLRVWTGGAVYGAPHVQRVIEVA